VDSHEEQPIRVGAARGARSEERSLVEMLCLRGTAGRRKGLDWDKWCWEDSGLEDWNKPVAEDMEYVRLLNSRLPPEPRCEEVFQR